MKIKTVLILLFVITTSKVYGQKYKEIEASYFFIENRKFINKKTQKELDGFFKIMNYDILSHTKRLKYDDNKFTLVEIKKGYIQGECKVFSFDRLAKSVNFIDGLKVGYYYLLSKNGKPNTIINYKLNKQKDSSLTTSYKNIKNGKVLITANYDTYGRVSQRVYYYTNGQKKREENLSFIFDKPLNNIDKFDENGNLKQKIKQFDEKTIKSTSYLDGKPLSTFVYDTISKLSSRKKLYPGTQFIQEELIRLKEGDDFVEYEYKFQKTGDTLSKKQTRNKKPFGHNYEKDYEGNIIYEKFYNKKGIPKGIHTFFTGENIIVNYSSKNQIKETYKKQIIKKYYKDGKLNKHEEYAEDLLIHSINYIYDENQKKLKKHGVEKMYSQLVGHNWTLNVPFDNGIINGSILYEDEKIKKKISVDSTEKITEYSFQHFVYGDNSTKDITLFLGKKRDSNYRAISIE